MVEEGEGDESVLERLAELTERTNQFNAKKVVYTEGGIRRYLREGGVCWSVDVSDRLVLGWLWRVQGLCLVWCISYLIHVNIPPFCLA